MSGVTPLPTPPSIADPENFDTLADAFLAALPQFVTEINTIIGVTIPAGSAAAGTLTGNTIASNVVTSSLTSVGALTGLTGAAAGGTWVGTGTNTIAQLPASATVAAHATTMNPWGAAQVVLSGIAVTFTNIAAAPYVGAVAWVKQNAAHIWTNGATFSIQGATNFNAAAGDWIRIYATTVSTFEITVFRVNGTGQILLSTQTAANVAALDFTGLTGFSSYLFIVDDLLAATDSANGLIRASVDNGANFLSTAIYAWVENGLINGSGSTGAGGGGATSSQWGRAMDNAASNGWSGTIVVTPNSALCKFTHNIFGYDGAAGALATYNGGGAISAASVNAIRFLMSSGNITSGTIKCYGIR